MRWRTKRMDRNQVLLVTPNLVLSQVRHKRPLFGGRYGCLNLYHRSLFFLARVFEVG